MKLSFAFVQAIIASIPDLSIGENLQRWHLYEAAKHRMFYTLLDLRVLLTTLRAGSGGGPGLDSLAETSCAN